MVIPQEALEKTGESSPSPAEGHGVSTERGAGVPAEAAAGQPDHRRAFPRIPCRVLVDYVIDGRAYRDCIANMSEGGAFIETSRAIEAGREITLSFSILEDQQPIKILGEVAWSSGTGVGVKFRHHPAISRFCSGEGTRPGAREGTDPGTQEGPHAGTQEGPHAGTQEGPHAGTQEGPLSGARPGPLARMHRGPWARRLRRREPAEGREAADSGQMPGTGLQGSARENPGARTQPRFTGNTRPVWGALLLVALLLLLERTQTNDRIVLLAEKVDRTSQDWLRLETRLTGLLERPGVMDLEVPSPALQSARPDRVAVRVRQTGPGKEVPETSTRVDEKVKTAALCLGRKTASVAPGLTAALSPDPKDVYPGGVEQPEAAALPGETASDPKSTDPPAATVAPAAKTVAAAPVTASSTRSMRAARATLTPAPGRETTYVVRQGDNLFRIGLKFKVPWKTLLEHNNLSSERAISAGQKIRIPLGQGM